jgi:predicted PurR-regulated permease PerM
MASNSLTTAMNSPPDDAAQAEAAAAAAGLPMAAAEAAEPSRVVIHMPVDVRSAALVVIAAVASLYALHWAQEVFIPVMVGLLLSYALSPIVTRLQAWRIPRAASAGALLTALFVGAGTMTWSLSDDANELIASLPAAVEKLKRSVRNLQGGQATPLAVVERAASQLEEVAQPTAPSSSTPRGVQRVVIERPRFDIRQYLWTGTVGLVAVLGQVCMMALIAFFLLASGDTFRRKMVKLAGPTLGRKKLTLQALNEISGQIQRYMLVQLFLSALVGVATWLSFEWLGLDHAAVWGVAAGVLNLVPYLGNALITGGSALVGFMQFGTLEMAATVAGISVVINAIEGFLLMPWLTSRANRMNAVSVFIGVLLLGWLWGAWGLLLAVPVLVIVKSVCDRVDDLKPLGELLGT